jgi:DNA primase
MSVAQQIKDRLDIVEYISRFVPELKKSGRYYKAPCPFHSEKTPSFVVNQDTQTWRCFGACAEGGDLFNFAMKRNGWSFGEALQELGRLAGVEVSTAPAEGREERAKHERLLGLLKTASEFYHRLLMSDRAEALPVREYALVSRGFTPETLERFQIGYAPKGWDNMLKALTDLGYTPDEVLEAGVASKNEDSGRIYDRFRHRLMIPIRDERGRVVGFGARALDADDKPKYLNSPQSVLFDKSRTLFGLDMAKSVIREGGTAVIVEGYMDAIQAHQAGYRNVVAQMGTAMTEAQLALLAPRYAKQIILALDADEAGQNAMRRSLEVARQALSKDLMGRMSVDIRILQVDNAKDPDDVLRETPHLWQGYIERAVHLADFVIEHELRTLTDKPTVQEKQAVAQRLLPILMASETDLVRHDNVQKLALRLRIEEAQLFAWADEWQRAEARKRKEASTPPAPKTAPPPTPASTPDDPFGDAPPPFDALASSAMSEEPPLWLDDMPAQAQAQPPADPAPKPTFAPTSATQRSSPPAERFCLRMLFGDDDFLYRVNGKFKAILDAYAGFKNHALTELMPDDFSQTEYRTLFAFLLEAHAQDEQTPMDYVRQRLPAELHDDFDALMVDEALDLFISMGGRLQNDAEDILEKVNRHRATDRERFEEALRGALRLRELRLQRELGELGFLMREAEASKDGDAVKRFAQSIAHVMRARGAFQKGLR